MNSLPSLLHIGVIRGGPSSDYDISLKTGAHILRNLSETHKPIDIFISRDGKWHLNGLERTPERIFKHVDVVFNAMHGTFGEDGKVQDILNHHGVKYVGSDKYPSAIAMNRWKAKEVLSLAGVKTPIFKIVRNTDSVFDKAKEIWNSMIHPLAVKPARGGSALGFAVVEKFDDLAHSIEDLLKNHDVVLVEEFIPGISVSCLVTDNFRGQDVYAFPPSTQLLVEETKNVEDIAKRVHSLLDLSHYSQSDLIVAPKRGVYFLEVNTHPKFTEKSLATKALEPVGVTPKDFLHHLIGLAMQS
ncbi:MAG: ATP-grasp domain-containing protein [Parcubacteria group bacterium]